MKYHRIDCNNGSHTTIINLDTIEFVDIAKSGKSCRVVFSSGSTKTFTMNESLNLVKALRQYQDQLTYNLCKDNNTEEF